MRKKKKKKKAYPLELLRQKVFFFLNYAAKDDNLKGEMSPEASPRRPEATPFIIPQNIACPRHAHFLRNPKHDLAKGEGSSGHFLRRATQEAPDTMKQLSLLITI